MNNIRSYGWKPGLPDHRDIKYSEQLKLLAITNKVKNIDLENQLPPCFDQLDLGSCTANAGAGFAQFLMNKLNKQVYLPSRLAIYYWERLLSNNINVDSGASVRDCMKVMNNIGVPHESLWTYNIKKFKVKPNIKVVEDANNHKIGLYLKLSQKLDELKECLINRFPFIFGFTAYDNFEGADVAKTGLLSLPNHSEALLGGHCVLAVGFDDKNRLFKIRNSWGINWGQKGYFWMPYDYILSPDLASDFWTTSSIN